LLGKKGYVVVVVVCIQKSFFVIWLSRTFVYPF